ncbi:MAG: hypothetical protein IJ655_00070 [Lachnospiraceae bacterium]|nr:hypothetical protein [Lachnospiraceae bacterium]
MKIRRIRSNCQKQKEIIGVIGATSKEDATHLSSAFANYLSSVEKLEVVYVEVGDYSKLYNMLKNKWMYDEKELIYYYKGISYLLAADEKKMAGKLRNPKQALYRDADVIILDLGEIFAGKEELIPICTRLFIAGNLLPWNIDSYAWLSEKILKLYGDVGCLERYSYNLTHEQKIIWYKKSKTEMKNLPMIGDPYCMKEKDIVTIRNILYGS